MQAAGNRGRLTGNPSRTRPKAPPRDRILDAAGELFGRRGVRAVGVDAIIAAAGVAKASFYRQFRSKDDLVVAWLRADRTRWLDDVVAEVERRADTPDAQVLAFFDVLGDLIAEQGYTGCAYLNTGVEFREGSKAIRDVVMEYLDEVEAYFLRLTRAMRAHAPELLALQLRLLCAGAIMTGSVLGDPSNARAARAAAEVLIRA
jgi:AcrR family transcriptional regulator